MQLLEEDVDLEKFFTDSKEARNTFEQLINSSELSKRILVIHGLGGSGKSTLLKMFRLTCHRQNIPVALIGAEEASSVMKVLADWSGDLKADKVKLNNFLKTLARYQALQAKVESETKKNSQLTQKLSQKAAKTAFDMAASMIPVVGPFVGALSDAGAEAFASWLQGFLSKSDLEFYLDPAKRLTEDFLSDLTRAASRQRIVLMIDTYEQITTLDQRVRELARHLPANVLLVLAGRAVPDWDRNWSDWMAHATIVEQKSMQPDDLRLLVRRYYAHIHGGEPDPQQVEAIVQFARGMPLVVTTVVRLWVKYGVEDFQTVRAQVVADLADRLLEGVPPQMRPAFEAAAVLRYFDADSLGALLESDDADSLYAELRRWPFIRLRREGLAVHDSMREIINEGLRTRTAERFQALHAQAAHYYEKGLTKLNEEGSILSEKWLKLALEMIYHLTRTDRRKGLEVGKQVVGFIYLFYRVDLMQPFLKELEEGASNEQADTYVLYERARLLLGNYKLQQAEEAFLKISRPEDGTGVVTKRDLLNSLGTVYYFQGNWKKALVCFQEGLANSRERKQDSAYNHMRIAKLYLVQGLINQAEKEFLIALDELQDMNEELLTPARVCYGLGDICVIDGRYNAALEWYDKSLGVLRQIKAWRDVIIALLNKSVLLSILGKSEESFEIVEEALKLAEEIKDERGVALAKCKFGDLTLLEKRWDKALNYYRESRAGFMAVEDNYFLVQTNLRIAIAREVPLDNPEMVSLCNEAESFCTKYEYWDQFAILQLVRANALWSTPGVHGANNWEVSLNYYQKAMIYALHYNRFALDEVLRGGELATPLLPIIPNCLERGEEGRNMLTALHDWWQSGKSELGVSRPDAILPLPEGMSLVEAERIAREREPGDGSPQKTVLEQIEKALSQGKFNS